MKTIGFFGGSFDPLHFGHINFAVEVFEKKQLDEIIFCPANISPFKQEDQPFCSSKHRVEMLKLFLSEIPHFSLCTEEIEREGVSYTIDTIRSLKKTYGESVHFRLLITEDHLANFYQWKDVQQIVQLAPPIVGSRLGTQGPDWNQYSTFMREILTDSLCPIPLMEISSTRVRERLDNEYYCGHLVPAIILEYIHRHGLY